MLMKRMNDFIEDAAQRMGEEEGQHAHRRHRCSHESRGGGLIRRRRTAAKYNKENLQQLLIKGTKTLMDKAAATADRNAKEVAGGGDAGKALPEAMKAQLMGARRTSVGTTRPRDD